MKKIAVIAFLIVASFSAQAQTEKISQSRITMHEVKFKSDTPLEMTGTIDFEEDKITITTGGKSDVYKIIHTEEGYSGTQYWSIKDGFMYSLVKDPTTFVLRVRKAKSAIMTFVYYY